ncbi:MAG: histidine phosphatase family protein, partial [SAR324 cluster bacterium]|nr:histidine phosphatase family protein [SAR324 cluster bacterium]
MSVLYLIRHGQASFGQPDYDKLSETGLWQARELGRHLSERAMKADTVFSGTMKRQSGTARELGAEFLEKGLFWPEVQENPLLNEFDHRKVVQCYLNNDSEKRAEWEAIVSDPQGSTSQRFETAFGKALERWASGEFDADYPESWQTFRERCRTALTTMMDNSGSSKNILAFTSGGVISVMCGLLLNISATETFNLNQVIVNSSVTAVKFGRDRVSLWYFNNFSHLEHHPGRVT